MVEVRPGCAPEYRFGDALKRVVRQVLAHVLARDVPDGEQHAVTLVVACAVLVRLTEVPERDWSVNSRNDLGEPDVARVAGQHVTAADTALRPHQTRALQREEDLLKIRLRQRGTHSDVPDRRGARLIGVERQ